MVQTSVRCRGDLVLPSHKHSNFTFPSLLWLQVDTYLDEDVESLRRTVQDLLVKLQEAERQHQSDRVDFEVRFGIWGEGALRVGPLDTGADEVFLAGVPSTGKARLCGLEHFLSALPFPGYL